MKWLLLTLIVASFISPLHGETHHKVVMISIDGLRGVELASLPNPHWNLPNLNEIVAKGSVSAGLLSVVPSNTYPNHTSLVTGVSPATHGILNNYLFDPEHELAPAESWNEYAPVIRVPTLWDLANQVGLRTGSVYWPVTVGAKIDANLPEHYPMETERDRLLYQVLGTPGLLSEYEKEFGVLPMGASFDDHIRAQMATFILQAKKPDLMLIHFVGLDHAEHQHGPDSSEAIQALENIDNCIGMVRKAVATTGLESQTVFVIVSDHGFFSVDKSFHPNAVLGSLGLLGSKEHPDNWRVAAFGGGGTFGLVAHDPNDREAIDLAVKTFRRLEKEGSWGIDQVLDGQQLQDSKGYSNSFLVVGMKPEFWADGGDVGPWLTPSRLKGMHGYLPGPRNMDAAFAVFGPGITHSSLPRGHVVDVAPTVASLLGLQMTNIEGVNMLPHK